MTEAYPIRHGHNEQRSEAEAAPSDDKLNREQQPSLNPRLYITRGLPLRAELTDGTWVDMAREPRDIYAEMYAVLAADEATESIPLYIWDYDGFGAFEVTTGAVDLEGVDSIELLAQVARGITQHGPAFAAYASAFDADPELLNLFAASYKGQHESMAAYVRQLFEPLRIEDRLQQAVPATLEEFVSVDYAAIGEEMLRQGDVVAIPAEGDAVWVFAK
ncbi:antirestriction protein ArdA [Nocardia brasiliensis]|uniref:antirestriction protein ArdA n=1 Tax=Nocardia brasiliensis TaxID=37326 RepID=UPI002457E5CB|nr:antirestriction protein ArdA [Nocardia brasiliensis]